MGCGHEYSASGLAGGFHPATFATFARSLRFRSTQSPPRSIRRCVEPPAAPCVHITVYRCCSRSASYLRSSCDPPAAAHSPATRSRSGWASRRRPLERGGNCVERKCSSRTQVASVAEGKAHPRRERPCRRGHAVQYPHAEDTSGRSGLGHPPVGGAGLRVGVRALRGQPGR